MVPGKEFDIGGKKYVVPALSLGALRGGMSSKLKEHDDLVAAGDFGSNLMILRGEIIIAAMRRNYTPDTVSDDEIWNGLDLANSNDIFMSVIGMSGFGLGEASPATGAAGNEPTTSSRSIPLSPPPTDGTSESSTTTQSAK